MQKEKRKPTRKWTSPRHTAVRNILYFPLYAYAKLVYRAAIGRYPNFDGSPCLILFNHQTAFDQFFVSLSFPKHVYYVSSEDLFSNGWISRLLSWLVAPVPFRKSTSDITAVKNCLQIAKEGGTIAMAPEGNRTYSGTTEHIKPSVASFAKALKLPVAIYRIEGGYGAHPRWSDTVRKGRMRCYFSRIIRPEEYQDMSKEELFAVLEKELYVDDRTDSTWFRGKRNAEYLDRAMYYCPFCGLSVFESKEDMITCRKCKRQIRYLPDKHLEGMGFDFPYSNVKDWYDAQNSFVRKLDLSPYAEKPAYSDTVCFIDNLYCRKKVILDKAAVIEIYAGRFVVTMKSEEFRFNFSDISSATVLGRNKLNLYIGNRILQFKGDKHFNALKYLNLYCHATNLASGEAETGFLGL